MKRDAQLTLRIPATLKEEIRIRAAKENRKPADAAVRILETNLVSADLFDAAKDALEVMPTGEQKDRLAFALLRGIGKMALALFLIWNGTSFGASPDACVAMCKIMNRSKGGVTCSIYYVDGTGGVLFLDFKKRTQDLAPEATLQWEGLRDAFVTTGGRVEMAVAGGKSINVCFSNTGRSADMNCAATDPKESHRLEIHTGGSRLIAGVKL